MPLSSSTYVLRPTSRRRVPCFAIIKTPFIPLPTMLEAPEEREREVGKKQQKRPRCDEAREGGKVEEGARAREAAISISCSVARWQNLIPSSPWIAPGWRAWGAQSKERKGSNFAAQRSRAIVQKPEGPNTYDLTIWL